MMHFVHESAEPPKVVEVFHTESHLENEMRVTMGQESQSALSTPSDSSFDGPCIYFHDTMAILENGSVGGKAVNMQKLGRIQNLCIPPWFVISSQFFQQFLEENNLIATLLQLDLLCKNPQKNSEAIKELGHQIRMLIQEKPLSQQLSLKIKEAYDRLSLLAHSAHPRFAVRSSGIMEDSAVSSCAGLYDTLLNECAFDSIIRAMKSVWASSFNPRVIQERIRLEIKQTQCQMGVIIQEQIEALSSGVISTLVLSNNYPGIQISGNYGVGESVVSGEVSVDSWVLHPSQGYILEEIKGSKESCHLLSAHEGIEMQSVPDEKRDAFVLNHKELASLFSQVKNIKDHYGCDVDIEYALDQQGNIFILQARPLVNVSAQEMRVVDVENAHNLNVLAKGHFSVPGVATGRLVFVESLEVLEKGEMLLQPEDIVLAYITTNVWSQYLGHVKGLVTREGSPASHPILLCREKQIPCVIGIANDFEQLIAHSKEMVTIDGFNKVIYSGEVKTKSASQNDLLEQFQPVSIRAWPDLSTSLPHLIHNKMAVEEGGIYWRRTPTYPVVGFQQELNLLRFDLVPSLLEKKDVKILSHVIDDYTCCELAPFSDYVSLFDGFDTKRALEFNQNHQDCIERFLTLSETATQSCEQWHDYIDAYAQLRSYIWLGDALRSYAQRKVEEMGMAMELPLFYLEECAKEIQAALPEIDTQMHQDLHALAIQVQEVPFFQDVATLKNMNQELYSLVEAIGKKYRFEHKISLDKEIDLNVVYTRLKREIETVQQGKSLSSDKRTDLSRHLLPGMDSLKNWLRVSIWNRILQSDSHHIDARAKEIVRPQLIKLAIALSHKGLLTSPESIFNCSIEDVGNYLREIHE